MAMEDDIKLAIDRDLPCQVGKVLRERLLHAEKDAARVAFLTDQLHAKERLLAKEKADLEAARATLARHDELSKRLAEVAERERNALIFELKANLAAQERVNQLQDKILLGLVRNVEYRTTLSETKNLVVPGANGCSSYTVTDPKTTSQEAQ
jgi:hypothetical protein